MSLVERYRGFVFDLDGTVYLGDRLLPGVARAIRAVRAAGRSILYVTNKPLEPSADYAAKLTALGLPTGPGEVLSSLDALRSYLRVTHPTARLLCVSEPLVEDTLTGDNWVVVDPVDAETADVVVVSFDRTFDYAKLHAAFRAVGSGAVVVGTNPDRYCPTPEGGLPDCAAMLAAIEACTGVTAEAVVGKPSPQMAAAVLERLSLAPDEVLMVGDRIETDVRMASNAGIDSALVLTGATSRADMAGSSLHPTYVFKGLGDLVDPAHSIPQTQR